MPGVGVAHSGCTSAGGHQGASAKHPRRQEGACWNLTITPASAMETRFPPLLWLGGDHCGCCPAHSLVIAWGEVHSAHVRMVEKAPRGHLKYECQQHPSSCCGVVSFERQTDLPPTKCLQHPGLGQAEARSRVPSMPVSCMGVAPRQLCLPRQAAGVSSKPAQAARHSETRNGPSEWALNLSTKHSPLQWIHWAIAHIQPPRGSLGQDCHTAPEAMLSPAVPGEKGLVLHGHRVTREPLCRYNHPGSASVYSEQGDGV